MYFICLRTRNIKSPSPTCHRCGGPHLALNCRFIKEKCRSCGKIGHIASVCRNKPLSTFPTRYHQKKPNRANTVSTVSNSTDNDTETTSNPAELYNMFAITSASKPICIPVQINGRRLEMELDTGAAVSVISEDKFNALQLQETIDIKPSNMIFCTYLGTVA